MFKLWLAYAIVSVADLALTILLLEPNTEGNLLARKVWSAFGYTGLIFYKTLIVFGVILPVCKYIESRSPKMCKSLLIFGIAVTSITCMFFTGVIL